jgi:hypothetical protein
MCIGIKNTDVFLDEAPQELLHHSRGEIDMQRRKKRGRKYPSRPVITPTTPQEFEAWYRAADSDAPLEPLQFAAGVIQHPDTGFYQCWLSTNGLDVICVCANYQEEAAEANLTLLKSLISSGDLYNEEKTAAVFEKLGQNSDEEPLPLPDDLVHEITRAILRAVVDKQA